MIGIDLFSGAGGMSLGAIAAGVDVQYVIDNDKHAAATYCLNHKPSLGFVNNDISLVEPPEINKNRPLIVFGGPPCQGFSTSNQRTRNASNSGNWLFKQFIRFVEFYKPEWVVFENVKGILETEGGLFVSEVINSLENIGFKCSYKVLNASDFGVPQKRERLFIVANSLGLNYKFPVKQTEAITVEEAIADLPFLENGAKENLQPYKMSPHSEYAALMRQKTGTSCTGHLVTRNSPLVLERYTHVLQGGNWESIPDKLMANYADKNRCHTGIYRRLQSDHPSVVIGNYRKNMLIHPHENRGLSVREAARLQSFPDDFVFSGSIGFQQQQVGNAVPPMLAKALFKSITKYHMEN